MKVEAGDRCFNEELSTKLKQLGLSNKEQAKALSRSPKTVVKPASAKALAHTQAILEILTIADSRQSVFEKAVQPERPRPMAEMPSLDTKAVLHFRPAVHSRTTSCSRSSLSR